MFLYSSNLHQHHTSITTQWVIIIRPSTFTSLWLEMDDKYKTEQNTYCEHAASDCPAPVLCYVLDMMEGNSNDTGCVLVHSDILVPMRWLRSLCSCSWSKHCPEKIIGCGVNTVCTWEGQQWIGNALTPGRRDLWEFRGAQIVIMG